MINCAGKKQRKGRSPLSQWNRQAVSCTAKIAQRNKQAHVTIHDCRLCHTILIPLVSQTVSVFLIIFSFFLLKHLQTAISRKESWRQNIFNTLQMLIFLMWCKSYPLGVNVTKISLFSAFKTCTISEQFLFERLQVYHSRDLSFIILEDRFVLCFLGCWGGGRKEGDKNNLKGSKVLRENA